MSKRGEKINYRILHKSEWTWSFREDPAQLAPSTRYRDFTKPAKDFTTVERLKDVACQKAEEYAETGAYAKVIYVDPETGDQTTVAVYDKRYKVRPGNAMIPFITRIKVGAEMLAAKYGWKTEKQEIKLANTNLEIYTFTKGETVIELIWALEAKIKPAYWVDWQLLSHSLRRADENYQQGAPPELLGTLLMQDGEMSLMQLLNLRMMASQQQNMTWVPSEEDLLAAGRTDLLISRAD